MGRWIPVAMQLPKAVYGGEGAPVEISEDVLILFEGGMVEVANYDHAIKQWALVNRSFREPECDPTHWLPIPEFPLS